ncbi:MAG: hydroxymethylglutaryl-CoA reductase, partial [Pseudomonadota bacterium]|nr:hydroxymethylglutaryl-CoA reductase [Pseudomonadota bacterium]
RQNFIQETTGVEPQHISHYNFDPTITEGNIENFVGVAQVPIGLAGPLLINGEHAQGEFYIPLATAEGTLVASYNRGMRLLREAGGVTVSVVDDVMQRAPVFIFDNAREARDFGLWVSENFDKIAQAAESTTRSGKLRNIEQYPAARMLYLRFNFSTGDAAGQNMVGKATFYACEWIKQNYPGYKNYILSGNMDTDKKHSQINTLHSRGKRVIAEAKIPGDLLESIMGVRPETMFRMRQISMTGGMMAGTSNNGAHSANGITAMFIATGQDAANVAESSAAISFADLDEEGNYYLSITIPSLICATFGGGTGLATQNECLRMLGCEGAGKAKKLAEIIGGVVLAGELSLSSAVLAGDWVSSHDKHGRNR